MSLDNDICREDLTENILRLQEDIMDEGAFNLIYEKTFRMAHYYISQHVKDKSEIDDVLQEVYIKMYTKVKDVKDQKAFYGWFMKLVHSTTIDYLRKKINKTDVPIDAIRDEEMVLVFSDRLNFPESHLDYMEQKNEIAGIVEQMPEKQKNVIMLMYFYDFKVMEIVDILGESEITIRKRVFDAKVTLRKKLKEKGIKFKGKSYGIFSKMFMVNKDNIHRLNFDGIFNINLDFVHMLTIDKFYFYFFQASSNYLYLSLAVATNVVTVAPEMALNYESLKAPILVNEQSYEEDVLDNNYIISNQDEKRTFNLDEKNTHLKESYFTLDFDKIPLATAEFYETDELVDYGYIENVDEQQLEKIDLEALEDEVLVELEDEVIENNDIISSITINYEVGHHVSKEKFIYDIYILSAKRINVDTAEIEGFEDINFHNKGVTTVVIKDDKQEFLANIYINEKNYPAFFINDIKLTYQVGKTISKEQILKDSGTVLESEDYFINFENYEEIDFEKVGNYFLYIHCSDNKGTEYPRKVIVISIKNIQH